MKRWADPDHSSPEHDFIAKEMNKDAVVRQVVADILDRLWPGKTKWHPSQINILDAASEQIVKAPSGFIVGFIDHLVDAEASTTNFLHLPIKRTYKFLFEIKPTIKSEGEVLRQINRYESYYKDRKLVLVTKGRINRDTKNYFEKNNVLVYEFERDSDATSASKVIERSKAASGSCIRCGGRIAFDINRPLCRSCFSTWAEFGNRDYEEKRCHSCGKLAQVSFRKPLCRSCYNSFAAKTN